MFTTLLTTFEKGIYTITVNRPDKLNAINAAVMSDLDQAFDEIYQRSDIRAVIITGAGSKSFIAGADIAEFSGVREEGASLSAKGQQVFMKIERCPRPVIAAVNGFALGAGCELAMSCHIRIASENARFGQPEVNLGLIPGYGGTQRLLQYIGKGRALHLLLTAGMIDATTALDYGLITSITKPEELLSSAKSLAQLLATKAPMALAGCIAAVNAAMEPGADGYAAEAEIFGSCFATEDMKEGKAAFLEKRNPEFKNR